MGQIQRDLLVVNTCRLIVRCLLGSFSKINNINFFKKKLTKIFIFSKKDEDRCRKITKKNKHNL